MPCLVADGSPCIDMSVLLGICDDELGDSVDNGEGVSIPSVARRKTMASRWISMHLTRGLLMFC